MDLLYGSQPVSICYTTVSAQIHVDKIKCEVATASGEFLCFQQEEGRQVLFHPDSPVQVRSVLRRIAKFADLQIPHRVEMLM